MRRSPQGLIIRIPVEAQARQTSCHAFSRAASNSEVHSTDVIPCMDSLALFFRVYVEGMAVGNITSTEVVDLAQHVQTVLKQRLGSQMVFPSQVRSLGSCRPSTGRMT